MANWAQTHNALESERISIEFNRDVVIGQLRQLGVDTKNERLIEMIATKFAGSTGSDVYDPSYISRIADTLVQFQLYGDRDFDEDDDDIGRRSRAPDDDFED